MLRKIHAYHIGVILLGCLLLISISLPLITTEPPVQPFLYKDNGELLSIPPLHPSQDHLLGTDRNGKDLLYALIEGAKYTIIFAGVVTLSRMIISLVAGLLFKRLFMNSWFGGLLQGFQYVPQSLIALLILSPLLFYELRTESVLSYNETLLIQLIVLVATGVFPLGKIIAETAQSLSRYEYVTCAKHMGASSIQIIMRHIFPHLLPRLFVICGRQFAQVLTLMLHLAIYHLFIGGIMISSGQEHDQFNNYNTLSNEWTGLISMYHRELMLDPFVIMFPVTAYTLLILSVNVMTKSLEKTVSKRLFYY
ncbi:ABC transporter permease subunit [Fictibacillus nanhaiensis]|uniref:ABC transporter permease subunit n=1 Tax=Fictibacillus nanhaiensis TaxID=742169 RepID=UPI001C95F596|nr:ABC transporter permease subunit [Fictibacillus nanhaiensis]MBY6038400.1 ABC transporter permease subunit [Fictibacillus nanhaiensis]